MSRSRIGTYGEPFCILDFHVLYASTWSTEDLAEASQDRTKSPRRTVVITCSGQAILRYKKADPFMSGQRLDRE
jgi:hypothetical protein